MTKQKLNAALKKFNEQSTIEEITAAGYNEDDSASIFAALHPEPVSVYNPNDDIDLSKFDYTKLSGDSYQEYITIAGKMGVEHGRVRYITELDLTKKYDFEQWKAVATTKFRLNEETGDKEQYIDGIKLMSPTLLMKTRISAKNAIDLNSQVSTNPAEHGNSKFYLLAK